MNRSERRQGERLTRGLSSGAKDFAGRDVSQQTFTFMQALDVLSAQALEHAQSARFKTDQMRQSDQHGRMRLMGEIQSHLLNSNEALTQCVRMLIESMVAQQNMPVKMQVHGDLGASAAGGSDDAPPDSSTQCPVKHEMLTVSPCPQCGAVITGDGNVGPGAT